MRIGRFATHFGLALTAVLALGGSIWPATMMAQGGPPMLMSQHQMSAPSPNGQTGAFVKAVREATRRFLDVSQAVAEGYVLQFGCVSGSDQGAMGVHFVNGALVADPALDVSQPELLVYEPQPNGRMRLVAADYLVIADAWHASNPAPPELMGQLFHLFESPNRFALPAFYTLHVWAWKDNPHGTFVNWNPDVSCDAFRPKNP